ncbi:MAG: hypothetical protein ABL962_19400 [Fimbriimonadaceae bacterium]
MKVTTFARAAPKFLVALLGGLSVGPTAWAAELSHLYGVNQVQRLDFQMHHDGETLVSPLAPGTIPGNAFSLKTKMGFPVKFSSETPDICVQLKNWGLENSNILFGTRSSSGGAVCDDTKPIRFDFYAHQYSFVGFHIIGRNPEGWTVTFKRDNASAVAKWVQQGGNSARLDHWVSFADAGANPSSLEGGRIISVEIVPNGGTPSFGIDNLILAH